jgi:hypothetical protein
VKVVIPEDEDENHASYRGNAKGCDSLMEEDIPEEAVGGFDSAIRVSFQIKKY